ncbi:MAG TPA: response regulator, partial [Myxococcota bacterium]|nr:response regulator [Myxococcota bacterium]
MSPARVLVVDDNLANLKLLAFLLKGHGYVVDVAIHAEEALERLAVSRPDLILLADNNSHLDSFKTCRALQAVEEVSKV